MPRTFSSRTFSSRAGFTLIEIMIVVLVIGILLSIAVPNWINARETSRSKACLSNLAHINSARLQCMMDNSISSSAATTFSIDGTTATTSGPDGVYQLTRSANSPNYLRSVPVCPGGGVYDVGTPHMDASCSLATAAEAPMDYRAGGRWSHGY